MTLQITLVGNDGWVLASDRKQVETLQIGPYTSSVDSAVAKINSDGDLTYSTVGDAVAVFAGDELSRWIRSGKIPMHHPEATRQALVAFGNKVWRRSRRDISKTIDPDFMARGLCVFFSPQARNFWVLKIGRTSIAQSYTDKCVLGNFANPATFFLERYYKPTLSPSQLSFLAAHIIHTGGLFNPMGVGGLDIVKSEGGKVKSLSLDELFALERRSIETDEQIESLFR